jgi:anti-sigma regulatory factor (Ser/Thr protein kinase)
MPGAVVLTGQGVGAPGTGTVMRATPPFAAINTAPGLARGHVRATLAEWGLGECADDAQRVASELVTNAVNASAPVLAVGRMPVIRVCLVTDGSALTVECWDQAPGFPALRAADELAEAGRGLAIIDAITGGRWGCRPAVGQVGKCVWAEIPLRDASLPLPVEEGFHGEGGRAQGYRSWA